MGKKIIISDPGDVRSIISEEETLFIFSVLHFCQIPEELIQPCLPDESNEISVSQKKELRKLCDKFDLDIISDQDGGVKIYLNNEDLIAEWFKPFIYLKKDLKVKNRNKQYYNEIHLKWWTIEENEND